MIQGNQLSNNIYRYCMYKDFIMPNDSARAVRKRKREKEIYNWLNIIPHPCSPFNHQIHSLSIIY